MKSSLRNRLVALFVVLVVVVGAATLYAIERTLADDLREALDTRLKHQGSQVATWLATGEDVPALVPRLAAVSGARLTILDADGSVLADSQLPALAGRPIGPGEPAQYVVAVPADAGRTIRMAVPMGEVVDTRARMRRRLLVGFGFGLLGAMLLSWIFVRAVTRPIQSMTRTAESLAAGNYDVPPPTAATQAGGELGVLARAMMHMAGEVKSRVEQLTDQRDLLSVVVGGLVEGVVVVGPDDSIVLANSAARPLIGDALPAPIVAMIAEARTGGEPEEELELSGRTVRVSARPLRGSTIIGVVTTKSTQAAPGTPSVIVVLYDITRMRALEAVRREFLSNAAHELRTPVTSISGYTETLLAGAVDPDTSKEFLTTIHRNARRISDMVSDLLVLEQLGGRATAVSERLSIALADVVDDAVRTTKGVKPGAAIEVSVEAGLAVLATREGLDHVVQNLIDNAVKYGGGTTVSVRATTHGKRIRLAVADQGAGIPSGHEERIFERFYRVDAGRSRDQGGSGLGLAIVKSHVEAMGGTVWYEHAEPGARFVVELDAAPAGAPVHRPSRRSARDVL